MICIFLTCRAALAQISPGTLSRAHVSLSGATQCANCHDLTTSPPEYKCLECHEEIRLRLDQKRGLHPSLVRNDRTGRSCVTCHSEHNGRNVSLIRWDTPVARFDHNRAGYPLEGKHATLACRTCHRPDRIAPAMAAGIKVQDLAQTWLGLPPRCSGCHTDEHQGQLSPECGRCHNSSRWQDAAQYNHDRAQFVLAGAHTKVDCRKCHPKIGDSRPYTKFRGLAFADCTPCHIDPHQGSFHQSCQTCHSPAGWKTLQGVSAFNHSTTDYPLTGKHEGVACQTCHRTTNFKLPIAHGRCLDCHTGDPHRGQFARRANGGECAACHTVEGFKPSTFTAASHATTSFPLTEKHATVVCSKCHEPRGAETRFRFADNACSACHPDAHKGQFLGAPYENRCESCHTAKGFSPSTFTLARHMKTSFPLTGAHAAYLCRECHKSRSDIYPPPPATFRFARHGCADCHTDPHKGELAARMAALGPDGNPKGCEACHSTKAWSAISGFDHATTSFPLEGAHRAVACDSCHRSRVLQAGLKKIAFKSAPRTCQACHEDIHGGQFSLGFGTPPDCSRCHRLDKWKPSTFDHDKFTTFRLTGAHKDVPCALCHTGTREIAARTVVMYKPTARDCRACHASTETRG
jgi:hypothetical protein